jgi:hypothetical protein
MSVTKATQLSETQYSHLLDVAKSLRGTYLQLSKDYCYRVYTEARKGGLRSKMCMGKANIKAIAKLNEAAKALYPHLDIVVEQNTSNYMSAIDDVCIFIKVK